MQVAGDYVESWQPMAMPPTALERLREIAQAITSSLGGRGIFGVELFVKGDQVWFSEVSPRPHDTGLVTLCSQRLFGKPESFLKRRMGVAVANADNTDEARVRARQAATLVKPVKA